MLRYDAAALRATLLFRCRCCRFRHTQRIIACRFIAATDMLDERCLPLLLTPLLPRRY